MAKKKPASKKTNGAEKAATSKKPSTKRKPKASERDAAPTGLHKVLADATTLIPPELLASFKGDVPARLSKFAEEGDYARWMDFLFLIGSAAEKWGRDAELPPDFWLNLAGAAKGMKFPSFVPYAMGKAHRRPLRVMTDILGAVVVIYREIGGRWAASFPDKPSLLDEFVRLIAAVDPAYPKLFKSKNSSELAHRFKADGLLAEPPTTWNAVREQCRQVFLPMVQFVLDDDFPETLDDERWSVIGFNQFELRYSGLFPTEVPWWW